MLICRTSVCSLRRSGPAVRPERLRRDADGPVRVRRKAHVGELHDRGAQQRLQQRRGARRHARIRQRLPNNDGRVRGDADDGDLVRPPDRAGVAEGNQELRSYSGARVAEEGGEEKKGRRRGRKKRGQRRPPRRLARATACRRCRSSANWWTVATGSSASRRSSSRRAISTRRATVLPPTSCSMG